MTFYTQAEVVKYMKEVAEYYQKEVEKYGDKLGSMLRTGPGEPAPKEEKKEDKSDKKSDPKARPSTGWVKMGALMLNSSNTKPATTEVMYQVHEELKQKLTKATEALKSFEQNANALVPPSATFLLYVRSGVAERVIVEAGAVKKANFNFDARFRVV